MSLVAVVPNVLVVNSANHARSVADLIGGQVDMMFDSITSARPHIESGRLRALGVTTARRSAALPGYELSPWFAVFVPAGTPRPLVEKMNAALLDAHLKAEMDKWSAVIAQRGIRADYALGANWR